MIVIYNESKTNWIRANINDKTSKLTTSRTLADGKVKYLDILMTNEIQTPDMNEFISMKECKVLYDGITNVKFKNKDLKPFITTADKYNTDIMLINVSLAGKIIKDIRTENTYIVGYLIAKGELFLIVSVRDTNDPTYIEVILHSSQIVADTTYKFEKKDGKYIATNDVAQVADVITNPSFKINIYRPARPTHAIIVNSSEYDALTKVLKYSDSHEITTFVDHNMDALASIIENLKRVGYKAITLYVNNNRFMGVNDHTYSNEFKTLKDNFKFVNILLNDGKVLRR